MFISKMALPRRTFLRGMGAALALPMLDAMTPALTAATPAPQRLGFIYLNNGVSMSLNNETNYWKPKVVGRLGEDISPILNPISAFRDQITVVSQMTHHSADSLGDGGNGDHTRASATWLNGVHPKHTSGADVRAGITVDQVAAKKLGRDTALPSLELAIDLDYLAGGCENGYSCIYVNTLAWMGPTEPLPTENSPRVVFERLFGDGGSAAQRIERARRGHSILDWSVTEMDRLKKTLGVADQSTVSDYFDSVREIEARIQHVEKQTGESAELPMERPTSIPTRFDDHVKLMFDLQWLAFQTDTTRVVTFMLGREMNGRSYPELGFPEAHHALSHHRDNPETMLKVAKINTYQAQTFAYFLEKLKSTKDADGSTLLDNTHILYGAGLSDPNAHAHRDMALLVAGGGAKYHNGGQHVVAPLDAPVCNLLLTMLDRAGVPTESLGDSTGQLKLDPLSLG